MRCLQFLCKCLSRIDLLENIEGELRDPFDSVQSIVPKVCGNILILKLLCSFLNVCHSSQFLVKTTEDMISVSFVCRFKWLSSLTPL
jgi:hypothetical protein